MKNYYFKLLVIFFSALLSGCTLFRSVETVALLPVMVVDKVIGTNMTRSIDRGINNGIESIDAGIKQSMRPGSPMDKQSIKTELSGKTIYISGNPVYLNANGDALFNSLRIEQYKWTVEKDGQICIIGNYCYEIRKKDNTILYLYGQKDEVLTVKEGDAEKLETHFVTQQEEDAIKKAEWERKQAEEKAAQERAEAEQKLAQEKAEAERRLAEQKAEAEQKRLAAIEEKCMRTPSCRAKRERAERIEAARRAKEERQRQIIAKQESKRACNGFYVGKTFKDKGKWGFSNTSKIVGIDKEENVLSLEISFWAGGKQTREDTCTHVRELIADGTVHEN